MKKIIAAVIVVAALAAVLAAVSFTVSQNEFAVVTRLGEPRQAISAPGLYWRWPAPIERVYRFDKRLQMHESLLAETLTRDKKNIAIRYMVAWKVTDPRAFLVAIGDSEAAAAKLDDLLTSKGAGAVGDFEFDDLISTDHEIKIPDLEQRIAGELTSFLSASNYGLEVETVEVNRLALPVNNKQAVYERMRAERRSIASRYRAEGEEEASKIRAQADLEKSRILAQALEESERIRGEGDAQAARIYADAFGKDPQFYQFWRTLRSYGKILDEKTTLVLSQDSELLKYLGGTSGLQ